MSVDQTISTFYLVPENIAKNTEAISEFTFSHRIVGWMQNMGRNMTRIVNDKRLQDLQEEMVRRHKGHSAIVIGGGPSLEKYEHLKMLAKSGYNGAVFTCDKNLVSCLKAGIIPDLVCTVDGAPIVANFYKDPIIKECYGKTKAAFCVQTVHPDVLARWGGETYWFVAIWDDPYKDPQTQQINPKSLTLTFHLMSGDKTILQTAGNVGTTLWNIAHYFQLNPICLVGFDMGYLRSSKVKDTPYYDTFHDMLKIQNKLSAEALARCYRRDYNPAFKNHSTTDLIFESYAAATKHFIALAKQMHGTDTINATGGGTLHGSMVESMSFQQFLEKYKQ